MCASRVAQWERAGPITQRSMDRNHPLLLLNFFYNNEISFFQPFLLGKARVPFRRWLMADSSSRAEAVVSSSVLKNRQNEYERRSGEKTLGKLTVSTQCCLY